MRLISVVFGVLSLAACGGEEADYSKETQEVFMVSCVGNGAEGDAMQEQLCGCMYQYFTENVPYDDFMAMERAALAGGDTAKLQEHSMKGLQQCIAEAGG